MTLGEGAGNALTAPATEMDGGICGVGIMKKGVTGRSWALLR